MNFNFAAHTLAKHASKVKKEHIWFNDTPNCIKYIVAKENECRTCKKDQFAHIADGIYNDHIAVEAGSKRSELCS